MAKTATINSRIEPSLKAQAEAIFVQLGLTASEAITLFYRQVTLQRGIPFGLKIPNAETMAAIEELEAGKGKRFDSLDDLWADLLSDADE